MAAIYQVNLPFISPVRAFAPELATKAVEYDSGVVSESLASFFYTQSNEFSSDFSSDFGFGILSGSFACSSEWIQISRADLTQDAEVSGNIRRSDMVIPGESLALVNRTDIKILSESIVFAYQNEIVSPEFTITSAVNANAALESMGAARLDVSLPVEWAGVSLANRIISNESVVSLRGDINSVQEMSRVALTDYAARSEMLIISRSDTSAGLEVINQLILAIYDCSSPIEWSSALRSDIPLAGEMTGNPRSDGLICLDSLSLARRDMAPLLEWNILSRYDSNIDGETSGPIRVDSPVSAEWSFLPGWVNYIASLESLSGQRYDAATGIEVISSVLVAVYDANTPVEWLSAQPADTISVAENVLNNLRRDISVKQEFIQATQTDKPVAAETGYALRSDSNVPDESSGNLRSDNAIEQDAAVGIRTDTALSQEVQQASGRDTPVAQEKIGASRLDSTIVWETIGISLRYDTPLISEILGTSAGNQTAPLDTPTGLRLDSKITLEESAGIRSDAIDFLEIPGLSWREDLSVSLEMSASARADAPSNAESSQATQAGLSVTAEHTIAGSPDYAISLECLLVSRSDLPIYIEALQSASLIVANWGTPIEWTISTRWDAESVAEGSTKSSYFSLGPFEWSSPNTPVPPIGPAFFTSYPIIIPRVAVVPPE